MGATNSSTRLHVRRTMFRRAKELSSAVNAFGRRRRQYLNAVLQGNISDAAAIEQKIIVLLEKTHRPEIQAILANARSRRNLLQMLREGYPLANAITIAVAKSKMPTTYLHLPGNPNHRKPKILRKELEITIYEYQTARLVLRKAKQNGLTGLLPELHKKIERKAQQILAYQHILSDAHRVE